MLDLLLLLRIFFNLVVPSCCQICASSPAPCRAAEEVQIYLRSLAGKRKWRSAVTRNTLLQSMLQKAIRNGSATHSNSSLGEQQPDTDTSVSS